MEKWHVITLILCAYGFFKEFRPSEPFVTEYLIDFKNFTKDTIVQVAYPIATYTYLGTLPIVFLLTDLLRYKSVIILEGLAFVITYILLLWGNGVNNLRVLEVFYGIASSTEIAYYTYIYAKVPKVTYKKVTSYTYTAILIGNFIAAVISQLFVSSGWMDYEELTYLTLGSVSIALIIAFFLPGANQSIYFHRNEDVLPLEGRQDQDQLDTTDKKKQNFLQKLRKAYGYLWIDCKKAYSSSYVLKWSIWWAIASACYIQTTSYVQPLWEEIYPSSEGDIYNGAVDAVHTILSAIFAMTFGYINFPWNKWGESILCIISLVQGAMLLIMSQTGQIFVAYVSYIVFRTLFQVMITVASAEVAQGISEDSYGLIFGINRFVALTFQTILTFAVADENGFALKERDQFVVYGGYFCALGILFAFVSLVSLVKNFRNLNKSSESPVQ